VSAPALLPRILPCGDAAISVEFGETIDPDLNARVLALHAALADVGLPGVIETVPTYRSLLIQFDPLATDLPGLEATIAQACRDLSGQARRTRRWRVPVVYGGDFGIDLESLAAHHDMSPDEVVARHSSGVYRVYMIGFMPGFAYLGGLDPALATPRRLEPRLETPAQSVSVGGAQAAISSVAAPSGWHLLGRTPARAFMPGRDPVFLYEAGDEVVFEPVPATRWDELDAAAGRGEAVAEFVAP
jgi:KipI family sensor histidine kinase inhibitor